jgi:hypothetical protein
LLYITSMICVCARLTSLRSSNRYLLDQRQRILTVSGNYSWLRISRPSVYTQTRLSASRVTPAKPPPTWVEQFPAKVQPYLYLTRIDKPIGTLLLYYPCGWCIDTSKQIASLNESRSLVNHNGLIRSTCSFHDSFDISGPIWSRSPSHAWRWLYNQRYVGQEPR